jgi:hypothetical protein
VCGESRTHGAERGKRWNAALTRRANLTYRYPAPMLMYGKEASNRKQEIDRQHYTIPNQRPKDKHCGKI